MIHAKRWATVMTVMLLLLVLGGGAMAETADKININTATAEELVQLDRVGAAYAQRIIEYRTQYGPFKAPEDIMQVAGIGQKTFEANKDRIAVE